MSEMNFTLHLRLKKEEIFFGNGIYDLLLLVEKYHSLNIASAKMGMSYSKAWKIVKKAEKELSFTILERTVGGTHGGGSVITKRGKEFMKKYEAFRNEVNENAAVVFDKYFG